MFKVAVTYSLTSEQVDASDTAGCIDLITCDECLFWQAICEKNWNAKKYHSVCDLRVV